MDFKQEVLQEAGDLQAAIRARAIREAGIHGELADVVSGAKPGRVDRDEITLFKSVGMATEDMATASYAYQQAVAAGVGTRIELNGSAFAQPAVVPG